VRRAAIGLPAAQPTRADVGAAAGRRDQVPVATRGRGPQPGYSPYSVETWRTWEYWANKAGCGHLLTRPDCGACAPAKRLIRKMGGSRSPPLLTLLNALTFARWSRQPVPAARRFRRASSDRGRSRLLSRGYRWFDPSPSSGESRAKRFTEHFDDEVVKDGR
jgi:hypothetical protein